MLIGLGYLFIGLALITSIGANWDNIPRAARMSGLLILTLATNLLGLHSFRSARKSAVMWFFLASLFYGASIMLIAQIYHIDEHYPDGILWWALGVLPLQCSRRAPSLWISRLRQGMVVWGQCSPRFLIF